MTHTGRETVNSVLVATVKPLASLLLRFGVNYLEFERLCREAFVAAAKDEITNRSRPITASQIALMTGMTRKVVKQIQSRQPADALLPEQSRSLPSEVLHVWHTDFRFCVTYGKPRSLAWDSGADSFSQLVRQCSKSVSPATVRAELIRVGAIVESEDGLLVATRRSFIPATADDRLVQGLQYGLRQLAMTIAHNARAEQPAGLRFQRIVWNYCGADAQRRTINELIARRLREFSQEVDDLLSEGERTENLHEQVVVGIGLYQFEDDPRNFYS